MSMNRWNYTEGNPINYSDPTGNSVCYDPLPASCLIGLMYANSFASAIKGYVESGMLLPVEGFAMLADNSKDHFNGDIRDLVWAMTIVLDDMDANRGLIWQQTSAAPFTIKSTRSPYFIKQDWLPYKHNSKYDRKPEEGNSWCYPEGSSNCVNEPWIHSLRGDWNTKYWDKTANQAYHFWFYVAVTFFDDSLFASYANFYHDNPYRVATYDFSGSAENEAPPTPNMSTQPDRNLAFAGIDLGHRLGREYIRSKYNCDPEIISSLISTDIGNWIRANLK
jgi:hypothetical protein